MQTTPAEIARRALADHLAALPASDLLARYATRQDPEAFAGLVQQLGPMVLGVCRRVLGSSADVDDAFQAVFLALSRQAGSFRDAQALPAWLHRVAVRVAHKALARRATKSEAPETVVDPADPFADVAWRDVRRVLDEELDRLPEKYRGPAVLCWLDGLTQDEAAGRVGVSLATLKRRLETGRELLRTRLLRRGVAPMLSAAAVATPTSLRTVVPESLKVLAVELGVGGAVSAGVAKLEVVVSATAPTRRAVLAALFGAGAVAAGGLAYAWNRSRTPREVATAPPALQPTEPRRVTAPRTRLVLNDPNGRVPFVAWTPDGKRIATDIGGTVRLWDAHTGKEVAAPLVGAYVGALHPGGHLLAYGIKDGSIKVWDFGAGMEFATLRPPNKFIKGPSPAGLVWSPDGKTLAILGEGPALVKNGWGDLVEGKAPVICIWDIVTQQSREIKAGVHSSDGSLSYSPNGKVLASITGRFNDFVQYWDVATGAKIAEHNFKEPGLHSGRAHWWSEDSTTFFLLVIGQTSPLKSFNPATGSAREEDLNLATGHMGEERPALMNWSEDGNVCAWSKTEGKEWRLSIEDWRARRVWAIADQEIIWPQPRRSEEVGRVRLSRDGTTLMTFRDGDILLWDVGPWEVLPPRTTTDPKKDQAKESQW